MTNVTKLTGAQTVLEERLLRPGHRRRPARLGRPAGQRPDDPQQARHGPGPVVRVAGLQPALPGHVRPRHAHGRHHRRARQRRHADTYTTDNTDFLGMAPGSRIVSLKLADAHGSTDVSQVIAAIDWVVAHGRDAGLNIRVMNLSFGTDSAQDYRLDPLAHAAEVAWNQGVVVVVSAGNGDGTRLGLANPAYDPAVIAVGAQNTKGTADRSDDAVPAFSQRGATALGMRAPDLVAPGASSSACGRRAPSSTPCTALVAPWGRGSSRAAAPRSPRLWSPVRQLCCSRSGPTSTRTRSRTSCGARRSRSPAPRRRRPGRRRPRPVQRLLRQRIARCRPQRQRRRRLAGQGPRPLQAQVQRRRADR